MDPRLKNLTPTLTADLGRLGVELARGRAPPELVAAVNGGLAALPPGLGWRPTDTIRERAGFRWDTGGPLRQMARGRPDLAWLFLLHPDGWVRQAALEACRPPDAPFFLAQLMTRLNDWVPQVRAAAEAAFERVLPGLDGELVLEAGVVLLTRMHDWRRWSTDGPERAERLFGTADFARQLGERLMRQAGGPQSRLLRHVLRRPLLDSRLEALALGAADPAVRRVVLLALLAGEVRWRDGFEHRDYRDIPRIRVRPLTAPPADPEGLIRRALGDPAAMVRRVAADGLIARRATYPDLEAATAALEADASPALRRRGEFLRKHGRALLYGRV